MMIIFCKSTEKCHIIEYPYLHDKRQNTKIEQFVINTQKLQVAEPVVFICAEQTISVDKFV